MHVFRKNHSPSNDKTGQMDHVRKIHRAWGSKELPRPWWQRNQRIQKVVGRKRFSSTLLDASGQTKNWIDVRWSNGRQSNRSLVYILGGSDGKVSACNAGDPGSLPGSGRSPGDGNGNPLQYPCLENPMVRGAWQVIVHGVAKSWTWLSDFTFFSIHGRDPDKLRHSPK